MTGPVLNLNLATRPLRNRRLFRAASRALVAILAVLAVLAALTVLKYGGEGSRLKSAMTETKRIGDQAAGESRRLKADVDREEKLSRARVNLINGIIQRKTFSWTGLLSELEKALPGPSYLTALSPSFASNGAMDLQMRVTSRSLEDLMAFITNLHGQGFKNIRTGSEQRSLEGRLIVEISATYERPL